MGRAGFGHRVEGLHAVAEAVSSSRVRTLYVERGRADRHEVVGLIEDVENAGGVVRTVDDVRTIAETTAPQGVVAECEPIRYSTLERLVEMTVPAAVLVVDRLQDPHNLGAVARSAVAAGVPGLVVSDRRAAPLSAAAFKAAAGALEHLAVAVVGSIADALSRLSGLGLWTVGLEGAGDRSLFGLELLAEPVALVVGGEGRGLSRLVGERVDVRAHIPMSGPVESLNASVAAALAVFELARVRDSQGSRRGDSNP